MKLYNEILSGIIYGGGSGGGGGYPEPSGTKSISITENGTTSYNIKDYETASVTVEVEGGGYPEPTGTLKTKFSANGKNTITVKDYEFAEVTVAVTEPSGNLTITENGDYDIKTKASVTVNVESGGGADHTIEDLLLTRGSSMPATYTNNRISSLGKYALYGTYVKSFSSTSILRLDAHAMDTAHYLTSVNLPACTVIDAYAFGTAGVEGSGFTAYMPSVTKINQYGFYQSYLSSATLTSVTSVAQSSFSYCAKLTELSLPSCTNVASQAFVSCTALTSLDLGNCTSIASNAFKSCTSLTDIYLRGDTVATYSTTATTGDPSNANLQIHVKADLLESYMTATNWSRLSSKFVGDL